MKEVKTDTSASKACIKVNVILTFNVDDGWGDYQKVFDLSLPLIDPDTDAVSFLNAQFFGRVKERCLLSGRNPRHLIKISTCGDWDAFERATGRPGLHRSGHTCKWHFGKARNDLDSWEEELMEDHGFGNDAYIAPPDLEETAAMLGFKRLYEQLCAERVRELP
jgi:hypothetical protein